MKLEIVTGSSVRSKVREAVDLDRVAEILCCRGVVKCVIYGTAGCQNHFNAHLSGSRSAITNTGVQELARYMRELAESIGFSQGGVTVLRT